MSQHRHLYNTARWQRLRSEQLRQHPLCRMHAELGRVVEARVVDHITPHRGDEELFFNRGNLQSLCKICHDAAKQAQERSAHGLLRGAGLDGQPLDLAHPWHARPAVVQAGGVEIFGGAAQQDRSRLVACKTAKSEGGGL